MSFASTSTATVTLHTRRPRVTMNRSRSPPPSRFRCAMLPGQRDHPHIGHGRDQRQQRAMACEEAPASCLALAPLLNEIVPAARKEEAAREVFPTDVPGAAGWRCGWRESATGSAAIRMSVWAQLRERQGILEERGIQDAAARWRARRSASDGAGSKTCTCRMRAIRRRPSRSTARHPDAPSAAIAPRHIPPRARLRSTPSSTRRRRSTAAE